MSRKLARIVAVTATCAAVLTLCGTTQAAPQESVTYSSVQSNGLLGESVNTVLSTNFGGSYTVYKIRVSGDLSSNGSGTFSSEAAIYVTPPSGPGFVLQPFSNNGFSATVGTVYTRAAGDAGTSGPAADAVFNAPAGGLSASGTWSFRFMESFDDAGNGTVDGLWNSITITLDDAAPTITALTPSGGNYTETEPNDANTSSIAPATLNIPATINHNTVTGMAAGETITGLTTGTTTNGLGTSIDFYRVSPATDTLGIYRYQLTITSAVAGHTGSLRGNNQINAAVTNAPQGGYVNRRVDVQLQTSSTAAAGATPARSNVWFGFGKGESILYAVTGTTATTANYVSTLTRTTVTPIAIATGPTINEGVLTITRQTGNANSLDFLVYDSNLNPIAGYAFENASTTVGGMQRLFTAGTYYIAVSNVNTANNNGNPADSTTRTSSVLQFPDAAINTSTTVTGAVTNVNLQIVAGANVTTPAAATPKANGFEVIWFTFTVALADCDTNGTSDLTQGNYVDCNTNAVMDFCDNTLGGVADCNTDNTLDVCQMVDCNTNGTLDKCEVGGDCDTDTIPDVCQFNPGDTNTTNSTPVTILDATTVFSLQSLPGGQIVDINVGLNIQHTFDSDIDITLIHNATTVTLSDDNGSSGDNYTGTVFDDAATLSIVGQVAPLTGTFKPETLLSNFNGQSRGGNWRLNLFDDAGGDTGTLLNWTLQIDVLGTTDCNTNGTYDACDPNDGNSNGTPDECEDCNTNGTGDQSEPGYADCNTNFTADFCEAPDCNTNGTLDICEMVDCNTNGTLDVCDLLAGAVDCDADLLIDACEMIDCNTNGILDQCDTAGSTSADCDNDNTPDECQLNQSMYMEVSSTDVPKAIPDSGGGLAVSTLTATGSGTVLDVNVGLSIRHTWDSDLDVALTKGATTAFVISVNGGSGDNFTGTVFDDEAVTPISAGLVPFTGTFIPLQALSAFDGGPKAGVWNLTAEDFAAGDTGTILSWKIGVTVLVANDCNSNGTPDQCDLDANSNGRPDDCEDCNTNGTPDSTEPGYQDCNTNDTADFCDLEVATAVDCNNDSTLDICQYGDCNTNDSLDECEGLADCNSNLTPDICELVDCNTNGTMDICDFPGSADCNTDNTPDECQLEGNTVHISTTPISIVDGLTNNGTINVTAGGTIIDVNVDLTLTHTWDSDVDVTLVHNGLTITLTDDNGGSGDNYTGTIFDDSAATSVTAGAAPFSNTFKPETPLAGYNGMDRSGSWRLNVGDDTGGDTGTVLQWSLHIMASGGDCDTNGTPDSCDVDANSNGTVDACEDCNTNGSTDNTEPGYQDCNSNLTADFCEIAYGSSADCNTDGTIDLCQMVDCNTNGILDICDLLAGAVDCNTNGIQDACEMVDCNTNNTLDICDILASGIDCNTSGVPDECELSSALGTLLVSQAPNASNGSFSDPTCSQCGAGAQAIADNFVLATGKTLKSIKLWGGYFSGNVAYATDNFTVVVHAANGAVPGAVLNSQSNVPSSRINTGFILFGVNRWEVTLTLASPVSLPAGTYWLQIYNSGSGTDTWFWEVGNLDAVNGVAGSAFSPAVPGAAWTAIAGEFAMNVSFADVANDCDTNGTPDECDFDGNNNGRPDACEDCNSNGTSDPNEAGYADCNTNGTADFCEAPDCDTDGTLDVCEFKDCNTNGVLDNCDAGYVDCDGNGTMDSCELLGDFANTDSSGLAIADNTTQSQSMTLPPGGVADVDVGLSIQHTWDSDLDITLVHSGTTVTLSDDNGGSGDNYTGTVFNQSASTSIVGALAPFTGTFIPETSLNAYNGMQRAGSWTLRIGDDVGGDTGTLLSWRLEVKNAASDCNTNNTPDACDAPDCNSNGTPDECEPVVDCNSNGTNDICENNDCNSNGTLDDCETLVDCDSNGTPDECEAGFADCNTNGTNDACDTPDCNTNGQPDECDLLVVSGMSMASSDTPLDIPDNDPFGVVSDITVTGSALVTDLNVSLSIQHTWDSDLYMVVFNDVSTNFTYLSAFNGGLSDNYTGTVFDDEASIPIASGTAPFTGTFLPDTSWGGTPLSGFDGAPKGALWSLYVEDTVGGDSGTILTWAVHITATEDHDANTNGTPDECEAPACPTCTGDINGDGFVDGQDIAGWIRCVVFSAPIGGDICGCSTGMTTAQFINKLLTDPNTACP